MFRFVCLVSLLALLVGCGPKDKPALVKVTGKVTKESAPVTAGSIIFYPDAANSYQKDNPSGMLEIDGSFTIKTFPFGEGVPPGKYKVILAPQLATRLEKPDYSKPDTTPWSIEVPEAGIADHVFEVK